jgi:tetratricopeptide (TPR) repeat protein
LNKAEFITLIDNPQTLDKSHITALKNIASDFPYFQAGHILLSKALFNENHYEFEKHLRSTALIASDRELLYRFLHDIPTNEESNEALANTALVDTPVMEMQVEFKEPVIETTIENETIILVEESIEINEEQKEDISEVQIEDQKEKIQPTIPEVHSFTEWLQLGSKIKEVESNKHKPVIEEKVNIEYQETTKPTSNIHEFESILDKFIRENPSISRPKAEFYNPSIMSKQSNEEDDDLVTETLAGIYYKQGAYKKAIRTYEKLCLIYPHKMTYFADLIQKIKQENKND